jgi:HK97 family phage major capsid protein
MAEFKYIKELLGTFSGVEGQLLIPRKIYDVLIEEVFKALIPRDEAAFYYGPDQIPGSSIDVDLVNRNTMNVRRISEGAEVTMDNATYTSVNLKPAKYGVALRVTSELLEDSKWNILEHQIRVAGRRLAENENSLVITALDTASNTVAGGAQVSIANITRAMQYLEDSDYYATSFIVGYEVLNDLRNIDTFVEFLKRGNTDFLDTGYLGTVYGMKVIKVSTNAGMTTTSAYVFDNRQAYAIAEKRPITVEQFDLPTFDLRAAVVSQRLTVSALRSEAIAKITSS